MSPDRTEVHPAVRRRACPHAPPTLTPVCLRHTNTIVVHNIDKQHTTGDDGKECLTYVMRQPHAIIVKVTTPRLLDQR